MDTVIYTYIYTYKTTLRVIRRFGEGGGDSLWTHSEMTFYKRTNEGLTKD